MKQNHTAGNQSAAGKSPAQSAPPPPKPKAAPPRPPYPPKPPLTSRHSGAGNTGNNRNRLGGKPSGGTAPQVERVPFATWLSQLNNGRASESSAGQNAPRAQAAQPTEHTRTGDKKPFTEGELYQDAQDPRLRHVLLYFIRLSLHVLENLLFTWLNTNTSKARRERRNAVAATITGMVNKDALEDGEFIAHIKDYHRRKIALETRESVRNDMQKRLTALEQDNALIELGRDFGDRDFIVYDFSNSRGQDILEQLAPEAKANLLNFLTHDMRYSDLASLGDLLFMIWILREYRNYLEHYEHKQTKGKKKRRTPTYLHKNADSILCKVMGRVLLPSLSGLLEGQLKRRGWNGAAGAIEYIRAGREQRKEARRIYANETIARKGKHAAKNKQRHISEQRLKKQRRQVLQKENENFRLQYLEWFPEDQRDAAPRLENFRAYYYAVGKEFLQRLKDESGAKSFAEVEMLYIMHHDLALRIATCIEQLQDKWLEGKSKTFIKEYGEDFAKLVRALPIYQQLPEECEVMIRIRNYIAHGRLVLQREDPQQVFSTIFTILKHENENERHNQLYTDLRRICKRGQKIVVRRQEQKQSKPQDGKSTSKPTGKQEQASHWRVVMASEHWKPTRRKKLQALKRKPSVSVERFGGLRRQAGKWVKALNNSYDPPKQRRNRSKRKPAG